MWWHAGVVCGMLSSKGMDNQNIPDDLTERMERATQALHMIAVTLKRLNERLDQALRPRDKGQAWRIT